MLFNFYEYHSQDNKSRGGSRATTDSFFVNSLKKINFNINLGGTIKCRSDLFDLPSLLKATLEDLFSNSSRSSTYIRIRFESFASNPVDVEVCKLEILDFRIRRLAS